MALKRGFILIFLKKKI